MECKVFGDPCQCNMKGIKGHLCCFKARFFILYMKLTDPIRFPKSAIRISRKIIRTDLCAPDGYIVKILEPDEIVDKGLISEGYWIRTCYEDTYMTKWGRTWTQFCSEVNK